jgi:hypothetical protein
MKTSKYAVCKQSNNFSRESDGRFAVGSSEAAAMRQVEAAERRLDSQRRMVAEAMSVGRATVDDVYEYIVDLLGACYLGDSEIERIMAM